MHDDGLTLAAFTQIYNEREKGNLDRFLSSMFPYIDRLYLYDDGSDDGGCELVDNYSRLHDVPVVSIFSPENEFNKEIHHKQRLMDLASLSMPEGGDSWFVWLDADEILDRRFAHNVREFLLDAPRDVDSFSMHEVNLWRSDTYYRVDNAYNDGIFCRFWRNKPGGLKFDVKDGLHNRQAPSNLTNEILIPRDTGVVIHYGFATDDSIIRKYNTYKEHGQRGWPLHRLIDENTLSLKRIKPEWIGESSLSFEPSPLHKPRLVDKI